MGRCSACEYITKAQWQIKRIAVASTAIPSERAHAPNLKTSSHVGSKITMSYIWIVCCIRTLSSVETCSCDFEILLQRQVTTSFSPSWVKILKPLSKFLILSHWCKINNYKYLLRISVPKHSPRLRDPPLVISYVRGIYNCFSCGYSYGHILINREILFVRSCINSKSSF